MDIDCSSVFPSFNSTVTYTCNFPTLYAFYCIVLCQACHNVHAKCDAPFLVSHFRPRFQPSAVMAVVTEHGVGVVPASFCVRPTMLCNRSAWRLHFVVFFFLNPCMGQCGRLRLPPLKVMLVGQYRRMNYSVSYRHLLIDMQRRTRRGFSAPALTGAI